MQALLEKFKAGNNGKEESKQEHQRVNLFYETVSSCVDAARQEAQHVIEEETKHEEEKPRIAVLLIVIDTIPFEEMWRAWAEHGKGHAQVGFFIHAKFPDRIRSQWARDRLVPKSFRPTWGSVQITMAMFYLLQRAYAHASKYDHFVFASETCLPVQSVETCTQLLQQTNHSWVNASFTPTNGFAQQKQFAPLTKLFPRDKVYKADQWMLLSRRHAAAVVELVSKANTRLKKDYQQSFSVVTASDEMFFPTTLAVLGISFSAEENDALNSVALRRVTFCDWTDEHDKNIRRERSPQSFQELSAEVLAQAIQEGCWFARKFTACAAVNYVSWARMVLGLAESDANDLMTQADTNALDDSANRRHRSNSLDDAQRSHNRAAARSRSRSRDRSRDSFRRRRRSRSRSDSRGRQRNRRRGWGRDSDRHRNSSWRR